MLLRFEPVVLVLLRYEPFVLVLPWRPTRTRPLPGCELVRTGAYSPLDVLPLILIDGRMPGGLSVAAESLRETLVGELEAIESVSAYASGSSAFGSPCVSAHVDHCVDAP